ncbi:MAG: S1C family serine protease [Acidobacteriota bacterium]
MDTTLLAFSNGLADAVAAAESAVVQVQGRRRPATGIAFAADLIVTTTRALGQEEGLRVSRGDGHTVAAEVAGWDPATSLVLLRAEGLQASPAVLSDTPPRVGHIALALARSWSNHITATTGVVSVIGGPLPTGRGRAIERVIRTSAPMHQGFAGGAFVDVLGRIVGVATAAEIRGLSVVIPADIAWPVAQRLTEHGTVQRGYLGLAGQVVHLAQRQREADREQALLVVGVSPNSPAEAGGILVGDVVVSFDGEPVQSPLDLVELLNSDRVGRAVTLRVVRGDVRQDLTVTVGTRAGR